MRIFYISLSLMLISGCATTSSLVERCQNSSSPYTMSNESAAYNEIAVRNLYRKLAKGSKSENANIDIGEVTKNTLTSTGAIDVYALINNLVKKSAIIDGMSESLSARTAKLATYNYRLNADQDSVCTLQKQLMNDS